MSDLPPLAEFLRSHRERLSPERAGLKDNGRRRTPGLRREEVAALSGVSIDYLVRLEQGRDTHPSQEVLLALADALQLDLEESRHLVALVSVGNSPQMERLCPPVPDLGAPVPPSVISMLDRFDPTPAYVVGPIGDVLAANAAWDALAAPLGLSVGSNVIRHAFTRPEVFVEGAAAADAAVARLREARLFHSDDERVAELLAELLEVPEFSLRWGGPALEAPARARLGLDHAELGELHLDVEVMDLASDGQQLVCWLPADAATESAVDGLIAERPVSPARLRVVGEE
jgi:transcriptional regulator with XRE-family HTH domain